jgi:hypothetical protein
MDEIHRPAPSDEATKDSEAEAHRSSVARGGQVNPEARHSGNSVEQPAGKPGAPRTITNESAGTEAQPSSSASAVEQEPIGPTHRDDN